MACTSAARPVRRISAQSAFRRAPVRSARNRPIIWAVQSKPSRWILRIALARMPTPHMAATTPGAASPGSMSAVQAVCAALSRMDTARPTSTRARASRISTWSTPSWSCRWAMQRLMPGSAILIAASRTIRTCRSICWAGWVTIQTTPSPITHWRSCLPISATIAAKPVHRYPMPLPERSIPATTPTSTMPISMPRACARIRWQRSD